MTDLPRLHATLRDLPTPSSGTEARSPAADPARADDPRDGRRPPPPRADENGGRGRYGGPWFEAAASLRLDGGLSRPDRIAQLLAAAIVRPKSFAALVALLLKTPTESVLLSRNNSGRALRGYFDERFLGVVPQNRLCRGVLLLPSDHEEYVRGRRRQALRTNLRRAELLGISCGAVEDPEACARVLRTIMADRSGTDEERAALILAWEPHFFRPETTTLVARDRAGEPLAISAVVVDHEVCLIQFALANRHEARWALHDHLVKILIDHGAKYLLAEGGGPFGALGLDAGLHHYQHLLGYQLRHLVPVIPSDAAGVRAGP